MVLLEPDVTPERKKRTIWLLAGGAASLLIPLAGAIYLHVSQNAGSAGPTGRSDVFERREGDDKKIMPTQTAVITTPPALTPVPSGMISGVAQKPAGSSLDFIQSGSELKAKMADAKATPQTPAAPAASTAPAPAAAAAADAPAAPAKKAKKGKKEFTMPKLQPTRGFTNFSSPAKSKSTSQASGQDAPGAATGLPPGVADDPRVQAYLKAHQGQ